MTWYDPRTWGAAAGDVAADALRHVLDEIYDQAVEHPQIILAPVAVLAIASAAVGGGAGYGAAYSTTAGVLDAIDDREDGFILPGGIL